ncbi:alpha/beta hydrolase [Promicromonospora aerolata]|uniref:Alpha/beta hydrolase n=1 Tax=Promicromonospora aerolata TaxID=195749 RepID=A0ABW4V3D0_9MICO
MPFGYLASAVILGLCVLAALRPWPGHSLFGTVVYVVGMTFNELPVVALVLALAPTVLALAQGDLSSPGGLAAAVVMLVVVIGIVLVAWRAVRARHEPEHALEEALGRGWRDRIAPEHAAHLRVAPDTWRGLLLPLLRRHHGVRHLRGLSYGEHGRRNTLDVYVPRGTAPSGPVFVHFHGGHFVSGAKDRESLHLLYQLAAHGWTCVSANYRLAPRAAFPDHVVDAKRVLHWVRTQGPERGLGAGPVFVGGSSAGAHIATCTALTAGDPALQPGFEEADTSVAGVVGMYGYYGPVTEDPGSSPAASVHAGAPPAYLTHGTRDTVAPIEWAREFKDRLAAVSDQPVVWSEIADGQHTFDYFASVRARVVADRIEGFAAWVLSRTP